MLTCNGNQPENRVPAVCWPNQIGLTYEDIARAWFKQNCAIMANHRHRQLQRFEAEAKYSVRVK